MTQPLKVTSGGASVATDANGFCVSPIGHQLGVVPTAVVCTGKGPVSGTPDVPASIIAYNFTAATFKVRFFRGDGTPLANATPFFTYVCVE